MRLQGFFHLMRAQSARNTLENVLFTQPTSHRGRSQPHSLLTGYPADKYWDFFFSSPAKHFSDHTETGLLASLARSTTSKTNPGAV